MALGIKRWPRLVAAGGAALMVAALGGFAIVHMGAREAPKPRTAALSAPSTTTARSADRRIVVSDASSATTAPPSSAPPVARSGARSAPGTTTTSPRVVPGPRSPSEAPPAPQPAPQLPAAPVIPPLVPDVLQSVQQQIDTLEPTNDGQVVAIRNARAALVQMQDASDPAKHDGVTDDVAFQQGVNNFVAAVVAFNAAGGQALVSQ